MLKSKKNLAVIIFLTINFIAAFEMSVAALKSGMCPSFPPDGKAFPCSPIQYFIFYFNQNIIGWGFPGQIIIIVISILLASLVHSLICFFQAKN